MDENTKIVVSVRDIVAIHNIVYNAHHTGDAILPMANILATTERILANPEMYKEPETEEEEENVTD
jgi:hypothetical protein